MSLDVTLSAVRMTVVYDANITHNLIRMAHEAGIYEAIWRPDENGFITAGHLIPIIEAGLTRLRQEPERFHAFEPENKWGTYEGFVAWLDKYLSACKENPDAEISVSR